MRSRADKIDEECVCIDSLVQRIRQLDGSNTVIVQREKNDPPDFWLSLSDRRLAVEVTSIVSDYGYPALCSALHSSVKSQCSGIAETYAIEVFRRPSIPKNGSNQWKALVAEAVISLQAMSGSPSTNPVVLLGDREGRLTLSKWGDTGSGVGLLRVPEAKFEGDAQKELSSLIGVAIAKKFEKCTKKVWAIYAMALSWPSMMLTDSETSTQFDRLYHSFKDMSGCTQSIEPVPSATVETCYTQTAQGVPVSSFTARKKSGIRAPNPRPQKNRNRTSHGPCRLGRKTLGAESRS